jgi:hypothetical protein
VSIDDRIRAATEATAATVREIRPLALPPDSAPERPRPRRAPRAWRGWLVPLAAGVAVVAVAAALVAVRDLSGATKAPPSAIPAAVPRYYAEITQGHGGPGALDVTVVDDRTGQQILTLAPRPGETFANVTGAADDRTFLLTSLVTSSATATTESPSLYLLRIDPGAADSYQLTKLPINLGARISDFTAVLSPDGQEIAALSTEASASLVKPTVLKIYSVSSGATLRTWATRQQVVMGTALGGQVVSWLSDGRHVAFSAETAATNPPTAPGYTTENAEERELDVTAPGGELMAASRVIFSRSQLNSTPCSSLNLTPDGGTLICSTKFMGNGRASPGCEAQGLELDAYSVPTGKRSGILYRYQPTCALGLAVVVWSGAAAKDVVAGIWSANSADSANSVNRAVHREQSNVSQTSLGVLVAGRLIELPLPLPPQWPGAVAF